MSLLPLFVPAINTYRTAATVAARRQALKRLAQLTTAEGGYWAASILGGSQVYKYFHSDGTMPKRTLHLRGRLGSALLHGSKRTKYSAPGRARRSTYRPGAPSKNRRTGGVIGRFQPSPGTEYKWKDTDYDITSASPGVVTSLVPTIIPRGTGPSDRIGTGVILKSLHFKGLALNDPLTASNGSGSFTYYLVLDKECNGVLPAVTDIFTGTDLTQAMIELANSARFVVIKKWIFNFNPGAGVSGAYSHQTRNIDYYAKCN